MYVLSRLRREHRLTHFSVVCILAYFSFVSTRVHLFPSLLDDRFCLLFVNFERRAPSCNSERLFFGRRYFSKPRFAQMKSHNKLG